jgi:hypothetical protein
MHSGCGKVHEACLLPKGQNILVYLVCGCFCLGTLYSRFLPCLPFRILWLLGCILCGHPRCETCAFAYLLYRLLVNAPFYCCKRLLHRQICFAISINFDTILGLVLPNSSTRSEQRRPAKKHLLPARQRRILWSFFIILHLCIYERRVSPFLCIQDLTSSIDAGCLYVERKFLAN